MFDTLILAFIFLGTICVLIGIFVGFVIGNAQFKRTLFVVIKSAIRIIVKSLKRKGELNIDSSRFRRDKDFVSLPVHIKSQLVDEHALKAVAALKNRLVRQYGSRIVKVFCMVLAPVAIIILIVTLMLQYSSLIQLTIVPRLKRNCYIKHMICC